MQTVYHFSVLFIFFVFLPIIFFKRGTMENIIAINDKKFVKYILKDEISAAVNKVAAAINEDYKDDVPLIIITLSGALIFAAELVQKLTINCRVTAVKLSSYHGGLSSSSKVESLIGLTENVKDQRVIIIEDIVDTGNTYEHMLKLLNEQSPKDVQIATMTFKRETYKKNLPVKYIGIEVPNKFIVGHGLDYQDLGRNLPDIYQLYEE